MKKALSLFLALALLLCMCAGTAFAEGDSSVTISLYIAGISETLYYDPAVTFDFDTETLTLAAALALFAGTDDAPVFDIVESEYGAYISAIGDDVEATFGGYDGWIVILNGALAAVGISDIELEDGDSVMLVYADLSTTLFPSKVEASLDDGVIVFTGVLVGWDDDGNVTYTPAPIADANVTWDGAEFVTDEDGAIVVDALGPEEARSAAAG